MSAQLAQDLHELRKWLNEEPNRPLDRIALARVLAAHEAEQALVALTAEQESLGMYDEAAPPHAGRADAQPVETQEIHPECAHLIWFDDQDRRPMMFAGPGAREWALKTYEQHSDQWNAHLFVCVDSNSRDSRYPVAAHLLAARAEKGGT